MHSALNSKFFIYFFLKRKLCIKDNVELVTLINEESGICVEWENFPKLIHQCDSLKLPLHWERFLQKLTSIGFILYQNWKIYI